MRRGSPTRTSAASVLVARCWRLSRTLATSTVVRAAAALAAARDAAVVVLNVVRIPQTLPIAEGRGYTHQAELVVEAVRALDRELPDVQLSTVVGIGRRISTVINTTAQREEADLIVVGWHGTVNEGSVRGSVAQEVLRTADRDVVVVKDSGLPDRIDDVVVGASPGIHMRQTMDLAADLARGFDATLRVLTIERPSDGDAAHKRFHDEMGDHLAAVLPSGRIELTASSPRM